MTLYRILAFIIILLITWFIIAISPIINPPPPTPIADARANCKKNYMCYNAMRGAQPIITDAATLRQHSTPTPVRVSTNWEIIRLN